LPQFLLKYTYVCQKVNDNPPGGTREINISLASPKGEGDVFIPFDVLVGKMMNKSIVVSVEFAAPLVNDYHQYDWMIGFCIGLSF
jgi:hypothetical protein